MDKDALGKVTVSTGTLTWPSDMLACVKRVPASVTVQASPPGRTRSPYLRQQGQQPTLNLLKRQDSTLQVRTDPRINVSYGQLETEKTACQCEHKDRYQAAELAQVDVAAEDLCHMRSVTCGQVSISIKRSFW